MKTRKIFSFNFPLIAIRDVFNFNSALGIANGGSALVPGGLVGMEYPK